jgi:hypothetical protein
VNGHIGCRAARAMCSGARRFPRKAARGLALTLPHFQRKKEGRAPVALFRRFYCQGLHEKKPQPLYA